MLQVSGHPEKEWLDVDVDRVSHSQDFNGNYVKGVRYE